MWISTRKYRIKEEYNGFYPEQLYLILGFIPVWFRFGKQYSPGNVCCSSIEYAKKFIETRNKPIKRHKYK